VYVVITGGKILRSPHLWSGFEEKVVALTYGEGTLPTTDNQLNKQVLWLQNRSVHNVRIERMWWDVTIQFGDKWKRFFMELETRYGLDIHNQKHKWLLHYLFLFMINNDIAAFIETWNNHKIRIRGEPNRSPIEIYGFDMGALGQRGDELDMEELETYGVDWQALGDDFVRRAQARNATHPGVTSWIGNSGPPPNLNRVVVDSPPRPDSQDFLEALDTALEHLWSQIDHDSLVQRWVVGLSHCMVQHEGF
jgi:hypothetical protein